MDIARKLKTFRNKAKLSQEALAARSGISRRAIQDIERKINKPTMVTLEALAGALRIPIGALADDTAAAEAIPLPSTLLEAADLIRAYEKAGPYTRAIVQFLLTREPSHLNALDQLPKATAQKLLALLLK